MGSSLSDRHIVGSLGNRPIPTIKPLEVQKTLNSLDVSSKLHKNKKDSRLSAGALAVVVYFKRSKNVGDNY